MKVYTDPRDEFLPTRNSLLSRLRDWDDHKSWREFFDTYWRFLFSIAQRCGLSEEDSRDVVQEAVLAAAKALRERKFVLTEGGSFKAWLHLVVRRRVCDTRRRARVRPRFVSPDEIEVPCSPAEEATEPGEILDRIWEEEWSRNVAEVALDRVKAKVGAKQFQMFDLYVIKGWPVQEVARILHVSVAQVYLAKHRMTIMIKRETVRLGKRMDLHGGFK